jgi:hypothetical protein
MTSVSNVGGKQEDKQKLINNLMAKGGLCDKYKDLKTNKGRTDFIFSIEDILKPYQDGGFGIIGWQRPYLDELLRLIDNQDDAIIKMVDADRFRLTSNAINRCRQMDSTMP